MSLPYAFAARRPALTGLAFTSRAVTTPFVRGPSEKMEISPEYFQYPLLERY